MCIVNSRHFCLQLYVSVPRRPRASIFEFCACLALRFFFFLHKGRTKSCMAICHKFCEINCAAEIQMKTSPGLSGPMPAIAFGVRCYQSMPPSNEWQHASISRGREQTHWHVSNISTACRCDRRRFGMQWQWFDSFNWFRVPHSDRWVWWSCSLIDWSFAWFQIDKGAYFVKHGGGVIAYSSEHRA